MMLCNSLLFPGERATVAVEEGVKRDETVGGCSNGLNRLSKFTVSHCKALRAVQPVRFAGGLGAPSNCGE